MGNTLLAIPNVNTCTILQLFLDIPQHLPSQLSAASHASPTELGEAAGETVADVCTGFCQACRAFCAVLRRRSSISEEESQLDERTTSTMSMQWVPPRAVENRGHSAHGLHHSSPPRQHGSAREVVLPTDGKLVEWK